MIGFGAEERRRALDRIDAAHARLHLIGAAARGEITRIAQMTGRGAECVALDAEDHIAAREIVDRIDRAAESDLGARSYGVAMERLPLMPHHPGKAVLQRRDLLSQGGRG